MWLSTKVRKQIQVVKNLPLSSTSITSAAKAAIEHLIGNPESTNPPGVKTSPRNPFTHSTLYNMISYLEHPRSILCTSKTTACSTTEKNNVSIEQDGKED